MSYLKAKVMKIWAFSVLCVLVMMSGIESVSAVQTAELVYVYNAGHNIVYTMHVTTNKIAIVNTSGNVNSECLLVNKYRDNDKVIVNIGSGTLVMDDEKVIYGSAVYVRQRTADSDVTQAY
jgi:hypothetical protein